MADFAGPAWRLPAAPGFSSPPEILRSPQSVESSCSSQDNVLNHTEMYVLPGASLCGWESTCARTKKMLQRWEKREDKALV
ncbi:uncharacterized protein FN964_015752 isoform 2-T2 [Alca torda]